ncbi:alpha/beta hydrolase [Psychrobacter piechaudii]|uniref:Alpha/beta hydrolase family protein n=1 Tax=Psychrobacter piechaudii TaxID=1945521 RepID=A0A1R4GXY6_9GAMM|nr:alpha/beta fold hydrolase [Psychrobacter piechaudii]SJM72903.1 Alpha/beta hydrolase family protein [Psychrobacter piechaudii]
MKTKTEEFLIDGPAGKLEVEALWQNEDPTDTNTKKVALLCHPNPLFDGTMKNKVVTTMFNFARDEGMHVVRFNFRGAGKSTGEHDYAVGEIEDAMAVLQWISDHTSANQLWLGGFSFGGYITARVAEQLLVTPHIWGLTEMELTKVILMAPSVENNDASDVMLPTQKTIQIYGDADTVIKPELMKKFAEDKQIASYVLEGAGHFFHGRLTEIRTLLEQHAV